MYVKAQTFNEYIDLPVIRRLWPADLLALRDHFMRIEADNNDLRVCSQTAGSNIVHSIETLNWDQTTLLGVFEGPALRGVAEIADDENGETAISFTLEAHFQNRGLGTQLLDRAMILARSGAKGRIYLACLPGNEKMQDVACKLGAQVTPWEDAKPKSHHSVLEIVENLNRHAILAWLDPVPS